MLEFSSEFIPGTKKEQPPQVERDGRVTVIDKPEGLYSIIYGVHAKAENIQDIPRNIDALVLETGTYEWGNDDTFSLDNLLAHPQYEALKSLLKERQCPIVLADPKVNFDLAVQGLEDIVKALEAAAGIKLASDVLKKLGKAKINRRAFLSTVIKAAAVPYLAMPMVGQLGRTFAGLTGEGHSSTANLKRM